MKFHFFNDINTFIQQRRIKLIYTLQQIILKKSITVSIKKILSYTIVFIVNINNSLIEWFLIDHVTLKTGVMAVEISFAITEVKPKKTVKI